MAVVGCTGTSPENTAASLYGVGQDPVEGNPGLPRSSGVRTPRGALLQVYGLRSSQPHRIGVGVASRGRRDLDDLGTWTLVVLAAPLLAEPTSSVDVPRGFALSPPKWVVVARGSPNEGTALPALGWGSRTDPSGSCSPSSGFRR